MHFTFKHVSDKLRSSSGVAIDSYSLIFILFNCALLMHLLMKAGGIIFLPVLLLLFNLRLRFVSIIQILIGFGLLAVSFPRQANHANIEFFISIAIIMALVSKVAQEEIRFSPDLMNYFFRIATVSIYFYAGFHKLNSDFFDMSVSCAKDFGRDGMSRILLHLQCYSCKNMLNALPLPYITVILEMVVPFGLIWHKSRKFAAMILLGFHMYLGIYSFANFSALIIFLLVGCLIDFNLKLSRRGIIALRAYMISVLLCAVFDLFKTGGLFGFFSYRIILTASVITFGTGTLWFFLIFFKEYKPVKSIFQIRYFSRLALLFAVISFWGLKNYAGLGTIGNFTMFSNLVTEKSRSNHLLIDTKKTKIWDFEEDYVKIIKLDETLKWQKTNKVIIAETLIPVIEFNYLIKNWSEEHSGKIPCTLIYKGKMLAIDDLKKSRFNNYNWWYRFLPFRMIQITGPNKCRW